MNKQLDIVVICNHKGGVSKSTTSYYLSQLFSTDNNKKVTRYEWQRSGQKTLLVTLDFQADLPKIILGEKFEGLKGGVLEAISEQDATDYTVQVNDKLWLLPATSTLAQFDEIYFTQLKDLEDVNKLLENALKPVIDDLEIEVIVIDTNPFMSKILLQGLNVSFGNKTNVIIPFSLEKSGKVSIDNIAETLVVTKKNANKNLNILGVVPVLIDAHESNFMKKYLDEVKQEYKGLLFDTTIKRRSKLKVMIEEGFDEKYAENRSALEDYYSLFKEVKERL